MDQGSSQIGAESDEQVAIRVQAGETQIFGEILSRYQAKITRYARKFLKDPKDAEDVVQEAFIKAYRNIRSFDPDRKFSSWLYRIAHNEAINFLKKRKIETLPLFDLDVLFPHLAREEHFSQTDAREIKELIDLSIDQLDLRYREPLVLYYIEGFDYKEIAEILHVPIPTVGVRLARGRKILRDHYSRLNPEQ